jgi:hypothetical protein
MYGQVNKHVEFKCTIKWSIPVFLESTFSSTVELLGLTNTASHITEELRMEDKKNQIDVKRLRWFTHVERMDEHTEYLKVYWK